MLSVLISIACRERKLLLDSLWWRWLAAAGHGGKAPRTWTGGKLELLELGLHREKLELPCGLQRCSGFRHLHWLPEEEAGLLWLSVSRERIECRKLVRKLINLFKQIHTLHTTVLNFKHCHCRDVQIQSPRTGSKPGFCPTMEKLFSPKEVEPQVKRRLPVG